MEKIAFFDIDHTIVKTSTGEHFISEARRRKLVSFAFIIQFLVYYFRYRFWMPKWDTYAGSIREIRGIPQPDFEVVVQAAFERLGKASIYPQMRQEIERLRAQGTKVVFATSSIDLLVRPLAEHLGVDEVISSRLEFVDGLATGRLVGPPAFGQEKLNKVIEAANLAGVDLKECSFYSDSIHDRPLLEKVGRPVAANPDHRLERLARKRGWHIMQCSLD